MLTCAHERLALANQSSMLTRAHERLALVEEGWGVLLHVDAFRRLQGFVSRRECSQEPQLATYAMLLSASSSSASCFGYGKR
jgi:hypothetical protein